MTIVITGGTYFERCLSPDSTELFGSGGRAAAALSGLTEVEFHTFFPRPSEEDVLLNMHAFGVKTTVHPSSAVVEFHYHFPLSPPRFAPIPLPSAPAARVVAEKIIRFGCVEGEMIVTADQAVYDPQSGSCPQAFKSNGSSAKRLAMVLNRSELQLLSGANDLEEQIHALTDRPEVVVVKCGPMGAYVFENGSLIGQAPIYKSYSVYKIGSGDIFTAIFAYYWMEMNLTPLDAAIKASRYVSHYVETRCNKMPDALPETESWTPKRDPGKVYLAGSFFSTEHVWLVEESYRALRSLGLSVFSPYHDVGVGTGPNIANQDLDGLSDCDVLFALLTDRDPGTIFEIGHGVANGKKIIAYSQNEGPQDLTMIRGTGCEIFDDLATAIYHVAWACME